MSKTFINEMEALENNSPAKTHNSKQKRREEHKLESFSCIFFFQAEDGIRDGTVTGVQTCALPIFVIRNGATEQRFTTSQLLSRPDVIALAGTGDIYRHRVVYRALPLSAILGDRRDSKIGRASCRERVAMSGVCG